MQKIYGKCALCREECELSFEHIPPKAAFNSTPVKPVTGTGMLEEDRMPWDTSGLHFKNQQKGMGKYSLCEKCNNDTGSWYGDEYIKITRIIHAIISQSAEINECACVIKNAYPLRFIKQVLSMFCSINNYDDQRIEILRKFVLDKEAVGIDKTKYRVCMYMTNSNLIKYAPLSVIVKFGSNEHEYNVLSEITAYPLGFILYFDPPESFQHNGVDITHFADCSYNQIANIQMPICMYEVNDFFPTHYRSKEEIRQCIKKNKEMVENIKKLTNSFIVY